MQWQDVVLSVGAVLLGVFLLPTIRGKDKPPVATSAGTSLVLCAWVVVFLSYELWFSAAVQAALVVGWAVIAIQKVRNDRQR